MRNPGSGRNRGMGITPLFSIAGKDNRSLRWDQTVTHKLHSDLLSLLVMLLANLLTVLVIVILQRRGKSDRAFATVQMGTLIILDVCYVVTAFINPGLVTVRPKK